MPGSPRSTRSADHDPASVGTAFIALPSRLPDGAGIGFKPDFFDGLIDGSHRPTFLEVHAENYMGAGGLPHFQLGRLRELYPISLHGVGLSIGGERPLDREHLRRLKSLVDRYEPASFSEHLAWSSHDVTYFNDLLPVAYTRETLDQVCDHIDLVQEQLGLRMLLENPSTYVEFSSSTMGEIEFLATIVRRTGCGLLLDVNNVQVSCTNHHRSPFAYLDAFPVEAVGEIHLGGHGVDEDDSGGRLLIDSHDRYVDPEVWALYARLLRRTGPCATLIEWDNDVPPLAELMSEARRAEEILHVEASGKRRIAGRRT